MIKIFKKSGIEEGKKIEYMSILFRPLETKEIWENCAKIIVSQTKEKTSNLLVIFLCSCICDILTDTVEYDDRRIDRVTEDCQHTCDTGITNG